MNNKNFLNFLCTLTVTLFPILLVWNVWDDRILVDKLLASDAILFLFTV